MLVGAKTAQLEGGTTTYNSRANSKSNAIFMGLCLMLTVLLRPTEANALYFPAWKFTKRF